MVCFACTHPLLHSSLAPLRLSSPRPLLPSPYPPLQAWLCAVLWVPDMLVERGGGLGASAGTERRNGERGTPREKMGRRGMRERETKRKKKGGLAGKTSPERKSLSWPHHLWPLVLSLGSSNFSQSYDGRSWSVSNACPRE